MTGEGARSADHCATISSGDFNLTARTSCRTHYLLQCLPAKGLGPHTLSSTGFYFYFVTTINISNINFSVPSLSKIANESPWSFQGIRGNHLLTYLPPLHSPSPPCAPSSPSSCARNVLMISLRFASIPATFPCCFSADATIKKMQRAHRQTQRAAAHEINELRMLLEERK